MVKLNSTTEVRSIVTIINPSYTSYLFLKCCIICSANNCKDLVSGKSGKHKVKYVTPIFKYFFISFNIVSGVPIINNFESFLIPFLQDVYAFLVRNSLSSIPRNKYHAML